MRRNGKEIQLAQALGWFSLSLGLAEVLAPRAVAKVAGIPFRSNIIRLLGLRELASGLGIFAQSRPTQALWSRVAGDLIDLGILGTALGSPKAARTRLAASLGAVAGITALDVYCSRKLTTNPQAAQGWQKVEAIVTINRPAAELYSFWHNFEQLPKFMSHLKSVRNIGGNRWHWVAKGPAGKDVEWDAEVTEDRANELIAWRSLAGSTVQNQGRVEFRPLKAGRGTAVKVSLRYLPPAGALGATVAKVFGQAPEKQVPADLRRFKQLIETGEIARTEGQPEGREYMSKYDRFVRK